MKVSHGGIQRCIKCNKGKKKKGLYCERCWLRATRQLRESGDKMFGFKKK